MSNLKKGYDVQSMAIWSRHSGGNDTRVLRMMTGDLSSGETLLMITEKQAAFSHAQIAGACALLTSGPVEASREND